MVSQHPQDGHPAKIMATLHPKLMKPDTTLRYSNQAWSLTLAQPRSDGGVPSPCVET